MKLFSYREVRQAQVFSLEGGQALHVWEHNGRFPNAPKVFLRHSEWAHLFDQDTERLKKTVRSLGVKQIFIHHPGTDRQHVDLCGSPLEKAKKQCS
jgi:hypothetical protein